jgi:hypothetical protein
MPGGGAGGASGGRSDAPNETGSVGTAGGAVRCECSSLLTGIGAGAITGVWVALDGQPGSAAGDSVEPDGHTGSAAGDSVGPDGHTAGDASNEGWFATRTERGALGSDAPSSGGEPDIGVAGVRTPASATRSRNQLVHDLPSHQRNRDGSSGSVYQAAIGVGMGSSAARVTVTKESSPQGLALRLDPWSDWNPRND